MKKAPFPIAPLITSPSWSIYKISHFPLLTFSIPPLTSPLLTAPFAMAASQSSILALIRHPFVQTFTWLYLILQAVLKYVFSPAPPPPTANKSNLPRKRVAVIGAGLTGVSSAAHCVGHGFDVQIFESRSKDRGLGGIWSVSLEPLTHSPPNTGPILTVNSELIPPQPSRCIA